MFTTFSAWVDLLFKAAGHKYIKRIPYSSGGKLRYRYIYKVTHTARGKHALHEDDVTVGAAFMLGTDKGSEVHAHVKSVDGDKVTVEYDDGPRKGEKETMSKRDLLSKLDAAHGISAALQSEREKQAKVISELRASGASEKQIAREQARLDRLGTVTTEADKLGAFARQVLEKARVTPDKVAAALTSFSKSRVSALINPDMIFRSRLHKLTAGDIADYCEQYNQALERAAQDNAAVLSAIAVYKQARKEALAAHPAAEMSGKERREKVEHYTKAAHHEFLTAISAANADFLHKSTPTNTLHARHKPAPSTPTNPEQFSGLGTLAHLEDILGRAYPARTHQITHIEMQMPSQVLRESCNKGTLTLCTASTLKTAAHELAHTLEQHGPAYAGIERAVTLTHATRIRQGKYKRYMGREMYFEDQYTNNYTGKLYADGGSELVSMGVENFFTSTEPDIQIKAIADFAAADPHHYLLTYAILKGYTQP